MTELEQQLQFAAKAYESSDYDTVLEVLRPLSEQGHAKAQTNLGFMYDQGHGVVQDYAEALSWYRLAADQGHAKAQTNLGSMYYQGHGVVQDNAEAVHWYRLAAKQGDAKAQFNLGVMYANGYGVVQDYGTAYMWLSISASTRPESAESRDIIAKELSSIDLENAQARSQSCVLSNYQECD